MTQQRCWNVSAGEEEDSSSHRVLKTVVLGLSAADEYALLESMDGAQEQFVLKRSLAGSSWGSIHAGSVVLVVVTGGRAGHVLEVLSVTSSSS